MIRNIAIGAVVLFGGFAAFVAAQPGDFTITRSATISAPPEIVYDQIDDFETWITWSPWSGLDPNQKVTFSGPATGVGASYEWNGNDDVGQGRMTVTEAVPPKKVVWDLHFIKPFEAQNVTTMTLEPEGDKTKVTWSMSGTNGFMGKAFGLMMDMDKMVGADFEKGLKTLDEKAQAQAKAVAEAKAKAEAEAKAIAEQEAAAAAAAEAITEGAGKVP